MNQSPKASGWCYVGVITQPQPQPQPQNQVALKKMNGDKGRGDEDGCCSKNVDDENMKWGWKSLQ